jgi:hypothetical protein
MCSSQMDSRCWLPAQNALAGHGKRPKHARLLCPASAGERRQTWCCKTSQELWQLNHVRLGQARSRTSRAGPFVDALGPPIYVYRSETERKYGWSGSRGGVSNESAAPKYRVNSTGQLVLADSDKPASTAQPSASSSSANARPTLKSALSESSNNGSKRARPN